MQSYKEELNQNDIEYEFLYEVFLNPTDESNILSKVLTQNYESTSKALNFNNHETMLLENIADEILAIKEVNSDKIQAENVIDVVQRILYNVLCKECGKNPQFFFVVLKMIKDNTMVPNYLKYQNISEFLQEYGDKFAHRNPTDLHNLFETANWMNVLFNFIAAKKNKGLVLAAVTKCVEGYQANYITGSGQKPSVDDRVYIYEREGNVVKDKRINKNENGSDSGDTKAKKVVRETKPKAPKLIKTPKATKVTESKSRIGTKDRNRLPASTSPIFPVNVKLAISEDVEDRHDDLPSEYAHLHFDANATQKCECLSQDTSIYQESCDSDSKLDSYIWNISAINQDWEMDSNLF